MCICIYVYVCNTFSSANILTRSSVSIPEIVYHGEKIKMNLMLKNVNTGFETDNEENSGNDNGTERFGAAEKDNTKQTAVG